MKQIITLLTFFALFGFATAQADDAVKTVSLQSLLSEMIDPTSIAKFPDPYYTCKQASSYDRATVAPDQPGWFANNDQGHFVREEMNGDRKEWVLMDVDGPGAIVRWWITAFHFKSTCRIYLDGSDTPAIEANVGEMVGGNYLVGAPLSRTAPLDLEHSGRNLYLPIPYAKHCKITIDQMPEQQVFYYQVNYRTYEPGTNVESFTMRNLKRIAPIIDSVQRTLSLGFQYNETIDEKLLISIKAGRSETMRDVHKTGCTSFALYLKADDMPKALRSTLVRISFDGKETVCCPVGDFFGTGVGIHPYKSWYTSVQKDGWLVSNWPMPYKESMVLKLENVGDAEVKVRLASFQSDLKWTDKTMYFHANWRQERGIKTLGGDGTKDFNYIAIKGKGVFAGDSLALVNHYPTWWGEGDEKIYVDGETFPSHIGTGTEDYYGYAWGSPNFFESPFHAQPIVERKDMFGKTVNSRYRILDGIPFRKDFRFDMEVWHWAPTEVDYAVTTYWYALGDAETNQPDNVIEEANIRFPDETDLRFELPGYKFEGKIVGNLSIQKLPDVPTEGEGVTPYEQLWWTGAKPNDQMNVVIHTDKSGAQELRVVLTKARDYGKVQFTLDGKELGEPLDLYNETVVRTKPITLGTVDIPAGDHVLGVKILGKNEKSVDYMFGLDEYEFVAK